MEKIVTQETLEQNLLHTQTKFIVQRQKQQLKAISGAMRVRRKLSSALIHTTSFAVLFTCPGAGKNPYCLCCPPTTDAHPEKDFVVLLYVQVHHTRAVMGGLLWLNLNVINCGKGHYQSLLHSLCPEVVLAHSKYSPSNQLLSCFPLPKLSVYQSLEGSKGFTPLEHLLGVA